MTNSNVCLFRFSLQNLESFYTYILAIQLFSRTLFLIGRPLTRPNNRNRARRQFRKQPPCTSNLCTSNTINEAIPPTNMRSATSTGISSTSCHILRVFPSPLACAQRLAGPAIGRLNAPRVQLRSRATKQRAQQHFQRNGTCWRNPTTAYPNKFRRSGI